MLAMLSPSHHIYRRLTETTSGDSFSIKPRRPPATFLTSRIWFQQRGDSRCIGKTAISHMQREYPLILSFNLSIQFFLFQSFFDNLVFTNLLYFLHNFSHAIFFSQIFIHNLSFTIFIFSLYFSISSKYRMHCCLLVGLFRYTTNCRTLPRCLQQRCNDLRSWNYVYVQAFLHISRL